MTIVKRLVKGSELTHAELDGNFTDLDDRVTTLEGSGGASISLTSLSVGSPASASGSGNLSYDNTTGVFTYTPPDLSSFATSALENVVEDTTPELGGDLVTGTNRLKFSSAGGSMLDFTVTQYAVANNTVLSSVGSINLFLDSASADSSGDTAFRIFDTTDPDGTVTEANNIFKVADTGDVSIKGKLLLPDGGASSNYAAFGDDDDLRIFHNGGHSIIRETGTGNLYLQSDNNVILGSDSGTETYVKGIYNGAVELYHNDVLKLNTSTSGVTVVDELHTEGATPHLTLQRTDNANVPTVRFKGSGGTIGASIDFDGTSGTANELAFQTYDGATIAERFRVTHTGAKVTGEILYSNVYSQLADLPDATTYHGMFAHVHATGKAYYAHAGNWVELANQADIGGGGGGASVTVQDDAPTSPAPTQGDLWWESDVGRLKIYYSGAWVDASPSGSGSGGATNMASLTDVDSVDTVASGDFLLYDGSSSEYKFVAFEAEVNGLIDSRTGGSGHISTQSQYTTTVTTDAADPTDTAHHVLSNTGTPSVHNASTAWYYGDVVSDPANPTTSVVLDIDGAILTADVVGNITSAGTSTFSGTVDFSNTSNVDFTGATVSGLSGTTWATLGDKDGANGPARILLGQNAVGGIESVAIGKGTHAGDYAQAIGNNAGNTGQGQGAVALGSQAGETGQEQKAIAIGNYAGQTGQGGNAIAIGEAAGRASQTANSIIINATGVDLNNTAPSTFTVKPIRNAPGAQALYYDPTSGEVTYDAAGGGGGLANVVDDTTPQLGGDLDVNGNDILLLDSRIKYNAAGGSMLDFTVTQYSVANNTVLSSVGSINLFLDSASADTSGDTAFRIFDTTDPDGTVTESSNIFKVADTGDVSIKGDLLINTNKFTVASATGNTTIAGTLDVDGSTSLDQTSINSNYGNQTALSVTAPNSQSVPTFSVTGSNGSVGFSVNAAGDETTIKGNLKVQNIQEEFATLTGATGTVTHNCDLQNIFYHTSPAADFTVNITNLTLIGGNATTVSLVIAQGATAYIPTAVQIGGVAQTLNWQGGSAPSGTSNGIDVVSLSILNNGGTYIVLGQLVGFG